MTTQTAPNSAPQIQHRTKLADLMAGLKKPKPITYDVLRARKRK